ncbi:hypothetical protein ACS0TY_017900 [Phlomoides rotata]
MLMLKELDPGEQPSQVRFKMTNYWMGLYDLPPATRSINNVRTIAGRCGTFKEVDSTTLDGFPRSIRLKVEIEITKPLKKGLRIVIPGHEHVWTPIKYERLPSFCYIYGLLGHLRRECDILSGDEKELTLSDDTLPYGDWMKASPIK